MLRQTAILIIDNKMTSANALKVAEIMHTRFTPRLHWADKSKLVFKLWKYKEKTKGWNREKVAEYTGLNYYYVCECIRMHNSVARFPLLARLPAKETAKKCLSSENVPNAIDMELNELKIKTMRINSESD